MRAERKRSLERGASAPGARVVTYEQALEAALHAFLRDGTVDMHDLAGSLAVSRATLYRVVGSRDRLLAGVLWFLARETMRMAEREAVSSGVERILEIATRFKQETAGFDPFRRFLRSDTETALRVLFTPAGGVHERMVRHWSRILTEAEEAGEVKLALPADDLAYIFVRIGESMLYADILIDRTPDLELASYVQRLLFER